MDITQIVITAGAIAGIVVVAVLAIIPTVLEIPSPDEVARRGRRSRRDWHLAA